MTARFAGLFHRMMLRRLWRHPLLSALNILGITLGVAVFLSIQMANRGAVAGFRAAAEMVTGHVDLEIRGDLPDDLVPKVKSVSGVRAVTPLVEGLVLLPDRKGEYLRILGVDPLSGAEFFSFRLSDTGEGNLDFERWLRDPEAIALAPSEVARLSAMGQADAIRVTSGSEQRTLKPAFVLEPPKSLADAGSHYAAMDIGWAQELLGKVGRLTSVQVLVNDPKQLGEIENALRQLAPADAVVGPPAQRSSEMEAMVGAFQLNLMALSLVSIVVGMFLISNSVAASVVRRRAEIAILRAIGATRWEIRSLFLGSALIEAAAGVGIGLAIAPLLARFLSAPLSQTISSLYEAVRIDRIALEPWQVAEGLAIGLAAALLAAWFPASDASRCEPARILHPGASAEILSPLRKPLLLAGAGILFVVAFLSSFYVLNGGEKLVGFLSAGAVIGAFTMLTPWISSGVAAAFRPLGILPRLAADHLVRSMHRNALTVAALAAAVAMMISVSVMIHSFRGSVQRWVERTLIADIYFAPAINDIVGPRAVLPAEAIDWVHAHPDVSAVATFREFPIRFRGEAVAMAVIDGKARGEIEFLDGPQTEAASAFAGGAVAVSESFAKRFKVKRGDSLEITTPGGDHAFAVSGIFRDFSRDQGSILIGRKNFDQYWNDRGVNSLALTLRDSTTRDRIAEEFRERFGSKGEFVIYDNASLRKRVFQIFDQTFAVTMVLRTIAIIVAIFGVLLSLGVLIAEREREIGVMRAIGASRSQILGVFLGEAGLVGLAAALCGVASGSVLAMVLTWVINKAFFGWTIDLAYPMATLVATPFWLVPVAILAALIPAARAAMIPPASAIRFE